MADGEGQCCKELLERPRNLLSQYDIYVVYFWPVSVSVLLMEEEHATLLQLHSVCCGVCSTAYSCSSHCCALTVSVHSSNN